MSAQQHEALRLADALEQAVYMLSVERDATAAELRRLDAVEKQRDQLQQAGLVACECCPHCGGSGDVMVMDSAGHDAYEVPADCPHCGGDGTLASAYQGVLKLLKAENAKYLKVCAELYFRPSAPQPAQQPLTDERVAYAKRYGWLRSRDVDAISSGGVFAGMTPENIVLNGETLDAAIDAAIERHPGIGSDT